jgi:uncharacterized protein DUF1566
MKKLLILLFIILGGLIVLILYPRLTDKPIGNNLPIDQAIVNKTDSRSAVLTQEEDDSIQTNSKKPSKLSQLIDKIIPGRKKASLYPIVDTGVTSFYNNDSVINKPDTNQPFFGQDAQYQKNQPSYTNNQDGTITDNITGLIWQKTMDQKMTTAQAEQAIQNFNLGGYDDWRIPTIKELYSLIQFTGQLSGQNANILFIDENFFDQPIGNIQEGEREIDAQTWSSTFYTAKTMNEEETLFGVNFIDGRIKGYGTYDRRDRQEKKMYFRFVRGNENYGENDFSDNKDGTITDSATGLMWQQTDSQKSMDWQEALEYAEALELAEFTDWRLPNAKELQSIVDYSRSPQLTNSAAIDPIFNISAIIDEKNQTNYPFFWTSTTHLDGIDPESHAVYISFGEALGKMQNEIMDVHGAGAQRSDPKSGSKDQYPSYFGPQGDVRRVFNYARAVRDVD